MHSLNILVSVYYHLRTYLDINGQLVVRTCHSLLQQYRARTLLRAVSNVSCEFRIDIRYCVDGLLAYRPLIERNIVIPLSHSLALRLVWKYLRVVVESIPESSREKAIRSLIQVPLDNRGLN